MTKNNKQAERDLLDLHTTSPIAEQASKADALEQPNSISLYTVPEDIADEATERSSTGRPNVIRWLKKNWLFTILVIIPVLTSTIYYAFLASDIYVSEAKFLVRSASRNAGGAAAYLGQGQGLARSSDDTYAVDEFIVSRDAVTDLARRMNLMDVFYRPETDILVHIPTWFFPVTADRFYKHYLNMVNVDTDNSSGITALEVKTYRPKDAQEVNRGLIQVAEDFINRMNLRAYDDALEFNEKIVQEAQDQLNQVEIRLAAYRNAQLILDPEKEATASMTLLSNLTTEISRLEAIVSQQIAMTPDSPSIEPLRQRIKSLRDELDRRQREIAGDQKSVATKLQGYEMLMLERDLAARRLAMAITDLEQARQEVQQQRVYLQTVEAPTLPDQATLPRRVLMVLATAILCLLVFWIARTFVSATRDHSP